MKTWFFTFTLTILFASGINSQQVSKKNWTLVHERTASWCPFCGTWGWNMKDEIFSTYADQNLIFMAVHHSGDLLNQTATEFGDNFSGTGQPIFYMDGSNLNVNSSNIAERIRDIKIAMDFKATQSVFAGVGVDATLNSSTKTLTAKAKVEFLEAVEGGDYYLGLYLVEDVLNFQSSRTGTPLHRNVLRQSLLPTTFGKTLKTGAVAKGAVFNVDASLANVNATRDKIKVVAIIWNKVGSKYIFFNANVVNVGIPASTDFEADINNDMIVTQNESNSVIVDIKNIVLDQDAVLSIADISGRLLASQQVIKNNSNQILILTGDFNQGVHIITLISDKKRISKKIVLH
jgi:hypothetical protein